MENRRILYYILAGFLVLVSIGVAGFVAYTATQRTLTGLESTLLQIFTLAIGLTGSFILVVSRFVRQQRKSSSSVPSPRSDAFFSLYKNLSRAAHIIESVKGKSHIMNYHLALARLEEIVKSQLMTADDALKDCERHCFGPCERGKTRKSHLTTQWRTDDEHTDSRKSRLCA